MATIPTFNNGEKLLNIRTQALNPAISQVNTLRGEVDTLKTSVANNTHSILVNSTELHKHDTRIDSSFVDCQVDGDKKTLTFHKSDGSHISCDLSPMFGGTPQPTGDNVYYGFSQTNTPTDTVVKTGTSDTVSSLAGYDVTMTRSDNTQKYMYFWADDKLGNIKGFNFSGFTDAWTSTALTIDGIAGKVYISDNTTGSNSVNFEVEV